MQSCQRVTPKQNNHDSFYLPDNIKHLGDMPLYKAVAWWGYLKGHEFTREDLSAAFHIDPRRASGVINYLCHRLRDDSIHIKARKVSRTKGNRALCLQIVAVS